MSVQLRYRVKKIIESSIVEKSIIGSQKASLLKPYGLKVGQKIAWLDDELDTAVGEIVEEKVENEEKPSSLLALIDARSGNKESLDYPDVLVTIDEVTEGSEVKHELDIIIKLNKEVRTKIKNCDPSVVSWLNEFGVKSGSKVAWLDYSGETHFGRFVIAGKNPKNKPECWFKKGRCLEPMYEVSYFVLLKS